MARVTSVNTVSFAVGGLVSALLSLWVMKKVTIVYMLNGMIAGLVSVTAGCSKFTIISAMIVSAISSFTWVLVSRLLIRWDQDDLFFSLTLDHVFIQNSYSWFSLIIPSCHIIKVNNDHSVFIHTLPPRIIMQLSHRWSFGSRGRASGSRNMGIYCCRLVQHGHRAFYCGV